jgi:hypothetical protein
MTSFVIASEAKQSMSPTTMDCFVASLLATTGINSVQIY